MALLSLNGIWLRMKALLQRARLDRDLEEELAHHLELRARKNREAGMGADEARYASRRQFGNTTVLKERSRELWAFAAVETFWEDIRYGSRRLRNNPGFAAVAVLTLALGVGANTAIFSVVKAVLFSTLPYRQPDRLVAVARGDSETPNPTNVSYGEVEDWKARTRSLQQFALYGGWTPASSDKNQPEIVYGLRVTRNFFETLGTSPSLGRAFLPEEDRPGRWHVVVLSHPYWVRRFGANPNAIGQTILLDQIPFQIIGVLPKNFEPLSFTDAGSPPDVWAPLGYDLSIPESGRSWQHLHAIARLADGVSLRAARAEMNSIASQLAKEFPKDYPPDANVLILPLRESWYGKITTALWLLFAATGVVLLIACANVANLLLAQSTKKRREVALRSVLGASRARIIRQLLTESTVLSVFGGIAGVLLALWGTTLLAKWTPDDIPRMTGLRFDPGVLLFTLGLTTTTGILMGLVPAMETSRADYREAIEQSSRGVRGVSRSRLRNVLVASQVCLAFVLTVASGLLLKSFVNALRVDPGFKVENLYEVNFRLVGAKYREDNGTRPPAWSSIVVRIQRETLERIRSIAGVESACLVSTPPISGSFGALDRSGFVIQDRRIADPAVPSVDRYIVSPDYFVSMGIPLLHGRLFTDADASSANQVAIISETAARQIFPGEDPLGKHIQLGGRHDDRPWATIIGVVGDVHQYGLDSPVTPQAYLLYSHSPFNYATVLMVRSNIGSAALTRAIEEQIWAIDKNTVVFNPAWMTDIVSHSLVPRRFTMFLLAGFGGLALLLAAIGIYGVMSYLVAQRTSEIGIRMALGAQAHDTLRLVSSDAMLRAGLGLLAGLVISLGLTRVLSSQLFAVSPLDPLTFGAVLLLLTIVALSACYLPARRAARVDPMIALRHE
jgi:putative ABC transport system permease protein